MFLSVIANVFAPWGIATSVTPAKVAVGMVVYVVKVSALALLIGVIESMFAKLRFFRVPELLGAAFILSLLALVFFYTLRGNAVSRCSTPLGSQLVDLCAVLLLLIVSRSWRNGGFRLVSTCSPSVRLSSGHGCIGGISHRVSSTSILPRRSPSHQGFCDSSDSAESDRATQRIA